MSDVQPGVQTEADPDVQLDGDRRTQRRSRARRGSGLVTIWWRDIPAQVTVTADGVDEKVLLTARFQHAIDRAASVAGLTATQPYVEQWRRTSVRVDGDAAAAAQLEADRLEADYPQDRLEELVMTGGLDAAHHHQEGDT